MLKSCGVARSLRQCNLKDRILFIFRILKQDFIKLKFFFSKLHFVLKKMVSLHFLLKELFK